MSVSKPKISFCIPTYNRVAWVGQAIESCLGQTLEDIEVVVVDDCSTDGTKDLLLHYKDNPKVKVIFNEVNKGAGESRNIGCEAANSEIICVMDSDDLCINTRAEETLKWFEKNPESELVTFPYITIGYFDQVIGDDKGRPFDHEAFKADGGISYFSNPSSAYKKKSALEMGGYKKEKEGITDDYQFVTNWVNSGKKIDFCGDNGKGEVPYVTLHRVLPDSMMAKIRGWSPQWVH